MTVQELIIKLEGIKDKDAPVEVSIKQYNQVGPIAYCQIYDNGYNHLQSNGLSHRIEVTLPYDNEKFMYTGNRKIK